MALETPDNKDDSFFKYTDIIFLAVFIIEMLLKMIARGVLPYPFFAEEKWETADHTDLNLIEMIELQCFHQVKAMKKADPENRILLEIQPDIVYKVLQTESVKNGSGWRVVHFFKTEDMRNF